MNAWMDAFEKTIISAVLTNNIELMRGADQIAVQYGFTPEMVIQCQTNVERWLRLHGIGKLLHHEYSAVVIIQSVIRSFCVRSKMKKKYQMLMNLAKLDDIAYLTEAQKLCWVK